MSGILGGSGVCVGSKVMVWLVVRVLVCFVDGTSDCVVQIGCSTGLMVELWASCGRGVDVFELGG